MDNLLKAEIITQFTAEYISNRDYQDFFDYNDLGVPIAVALKGNFVTLTSEGEKLFNETYSQLCKLFDADENEEYEDLDELIGE